MRRVVAGLAAVVSTALLLGGPARGEETPDVDLSGVEDIAEIDLESLLEIESATKTAMRSAEAPSIVTVIPRSTLLARGYRSVAEALAGVPGLYVIDDHVTANVAIRGIHGGPDSWSRVIKVLINGQPVTYYSTGGALLGPELIPIDAVERIEVIRGPASALYGGNAFLGVVNVVTRAPEEGGRLAASAEVGLVRGNPSLTGQLVGGVASSDASLFGAIGAAYLDRSGLAVPPGSPAAGAYSGRVSKGDLSRPMSAFVTGRFDGGELGAVSVQLLHQRLDAHSEFSDVGVLTHNTRIALANTVGRLDYEKALWDELLTLRAFGAVSHGQTLPEEILDDGSRAFTIFRDRHNTALSSGLELGGAFERHAFLAGLDLLVDEDAGDTIYQVRRDEGGHGGNAGSRVLREHGHPLRYSNVGVYAQATLQLLDPVAATAGVRYDHNSLWGPSLNGRLGVVWELLEGLHLKGLYGSSFLPPAPTQLNAAPVGLGTVRGNQDLKSQSAHTVEAAVAYSWSQDLALQANAFYTLIQDRIEFVDVGSNLTARNLTASHSFGAEASVDWRFSPFFAQANLSLQNTVVEPPDPAPSYWRIVFDPEGPGGALPPGFPLAMGHATFGVTLPEWFLQASVTAHLASERKASLSNIRRLGRSYTLPPYATFDANLRTLELRPFAGRETALSLHVTNLLDTAYAEPGTQGVDIPALGRTVFAKVTQEF